MRKIIIFLILTSSFLFGGLKVPVTELVLKDRLWFYGESENPFTGVAFATSKVTGTIVQQTNFIDGLAWGKYYEWWADGEKKVDGTYRYGLMFGRWKFFYMDGQTLCAGSYNSGKGHTPITLLDTIPEEGINGLWTYWNKDGRKIEEGYYNKNGIEKGNWAFWDNDGKKRLGKKISYQIFKNKNSIKHLNGSFLVAGPLNGLKKIQTQAHGTIKEGRLDGLWTFWNDNGYLSSKQYYKKGSPEGQYTSYSLSGKKNEDGLVKGLDNFGNLIKEGKWIFWNEQGILKEEVNFEDGIREGLTTYFSSTGNENAKIIYKYDAPWSGEWTKWYSDGSKKEKGFYEDGEKKSPWTTWFENGQKKYVVNYQNNIKHGLYTEWNQDGRLIKDIDYDNGNRISEYLVEYKGDGYTEINKRNGDLSGSWIMWYANGKKGEEGFYKNGKKSGSWNGWYVNGEKKYNGKFINGQPEGFHIDLDKNGLVTKNIDFNLGLVLSEYHVLREDDAITEFHKKNGVLDGLWTRWYSNGQKAEEGLYKNGKKSGKWNAWFTNNKKKYTSEYDAGKRSNVYIAWDKKGKKIQEINYSNGIRIKEYLIVKDATGFMEINKKNGSLDGGWVKWYSDGKKEEEGVYLKGKKIGSWSKYSMSGIVVEELNYDTYGRNLYEITYYNNGTVKKYCDYFSKTVQEYNSDGSMKGEKTSF